MPIPPLLFRTTVTPTPDPEPTPTPIPQQLQSYLDRIAWAQARRQIRRRARLR